MATYLIHLSRRFKGSFKVVYKAAGLLESIENITNIDTPEDLARSLIRIPVHETGIEHLRQQGTKVQKAPEDLSFDRFWSKYNYKVGKIQRAKKLWENLPEVDKIDALNKIDRYNAWLSQRTIEKAYPETYLSQRRWENDFQGVGSLF